MIAVRARLLGSGRPPLQAGAPFAWGYTPVSGAFDPSRVFGMQFSVASGALSSGAALQADLWVDDIYLIQRAPAP
jgi:hypothetical protein